MLLNFDAVTEAAEASEDWGKPHVIVTYETDPRILRRDLTQFVSVRGPYPTYADAAAAEPEVTAQMNAGDQLPPFVSHIVRMWDPEGRN